MSILVGDETRLLVQGITGREGGFHAQQMQDYGTKIVAGSTPGKGGQTALENPVPVFNSCHEAVAESDANTPSLSNFGLNAASMPWIGELCSDSSARDTR